MRRIFKGFLAAAVLVFCFGAGTVTGSGRGRMGSRDKETVPETLKMSEETVTGTRGTEEEMKETEQAFYSTEITDELMERMRRKS